MLTDGTCTSTCTIFSEPIKNVGGVKSIPFGGRPQQGPMKAIGGSKGCAVAKAQNLVALRESANTVASMADAHGKPSLSRQEHARLNATMPGAFPLEFNTLSFNFKNAYREGDDEMPPQFLYDPADCRLFYACENIVNPVSTWISVANASGVMVLVFLALTLLLTGLSGQLRLRGSDGLIV
ncbi:peptidase S41 family protein [Aspergillus affinis]|uniref:peptidase S41 family protein n=1 Tax=Aspergillus affinis TaxID=1070780 RepID=UPI0022FEAAE8|nr:peptidase S41 family protein [Aspergillus affinis]KAI9045960.1 peptidase S41 family protein [Aspergillus affinis]